MSEPRYIYLVMYDVREPKRLKRVHKILREWGEPLQYSVFNVRATKREMEELRCRVTRLVEAEDSVLWFRLCQVCANQLVVQGEPHVHLDVRPPIARVV
jgi:CRISPR-associated protein Cas2